MHAGTWLARPGLWVAGSLALMVAGAFGPWARVLDTITINGTDSGKDGWVVLGAAIVAALGLALFTKLRRRWLLAFPLLGGLVGGGTSGYDLNDLGRFGSLASAQWGIYVALAGSIALVVTTLWLAFSRQPARKAEAAAV
jgi:hypothetical protein